MSDEKKHGNNQIEADSPNAKVRELQQQLEEQQKELQLAAEIGQQLLGDNQNLEKQLDQTVQDCSAKIEELRQERHTLQLRLDQKVQMVRNNMDDIESLKGQMAVQKADFEMEVLTEHVSTVNQLNKQVAILRAESEQSQLKISHLEEKEEESKQMVMQLQGQLKDKPNILDETCSEEIAQLHTDLCLLKNEKMLLETEGRESKRQIQQLQSSLTAAQNQVAAGQQEVEEQECQTTAYYNALERSKEELRDMKMELELMKAESQDRNKKGNSLFSEVEDRRVEVEKLLITVKVQNETLKKQYQIAKEQLHKSKLQMASLLQMSTGRANSEHLVRLQEQLEQAREEICTLTNKLTTAQKQGDSKGGNWKKVLDEAANKDYVEFVESLMKARDKEVCKLQEELATKNMQLMIENRSVIDCQQKLYAKERNLEKQIGYAMKLRVRLEELEMQYEPEKVTSRSRGLKFVAEKIPVSKPVEAGAANSSVVEKTNNKENTGSKEAGKIHSESQAAEHKQKLGVKPTTDQSKTNQNDFFSALMAVGLQVHGKPANDTTVKLQKVKKVSLNDDVEVIDISAENISKDSEVCPEDPQAKVKAREVKGRQQYKGKTVKVPRAPQEQGDCKTQ